MWHLKLLLKTGTTPLFVSSLFLDVSYIFTLREASCHVWAAQWRGPSGKEPRTTSYHSPYRTETFSPTAYKELKILPTTSWVSLEADPPLVKHSDEITAPGCTLIVTCWRLLLKATELEVNLLGKQITKGKAKESKAKENITNRVARKIFTSLFLSNISCSPQKIQFIVFSLPKSKSSDIVTVILQRKPALPMGEPEPTSTVC